ncbi:MAG: hypothetical protein WBN59_15190 [Flavobacteriaceae bacterium]
MLAIVLAGIMIGFARESNLLKKVRTSFEKQEGNWRDMNDLASVGQLL